GHVLLEDMPGLAKTLIARSFATVTGLDFGRVQFTPDLMPADITGSAIYDQRSGSFTFQPGPVFTNLLVADEINRTPPKTQAALLEAMQERQITVDGATRPLELPFLVVATQNPIEYEGTYPLPEAQLDRFLVRVSVGYPTQDDEWAVLAGRIDRRAPEVELRSIVDRAELLDMQHSLEDVHVDESIGRYVVAVVDATRSRPTLELGASPRGSLALLLLSRAKAVLSGRDYVVPEDVKSVAVPALAHRLRLRPDLWVRGVRAEDVVRDCLAEVPAPPAQQPEVGVGASTEAGAP
ncbi:MAG: AAA family ATPase, partial [Acidimicrobiia bacterium]